MSVPTPRRLTRRAFLREATVAGAVASASVTDPLPAYPQISTEPVS